MIDIDLSGKVAVVTGAGGGIGNGIAGRLLLAGARVYLVDIVEEKVLSLAEGYQKQGLAAYSKKLDITVEGDVNTAIDEIAGENGGTLDILVNGAGMMIAKPYMDSTVSEFAKTLNLNLLSMHLMTARALKYMMQSGSGRIVNLGSGSSRQGYPNFVFYSASKFGVIGFTQAVARAVAAQNITVNAVCPGVVRTPLFEKILLDKVEKSNGALTLEAAWADVEKGVPNRRLQTPEDIGNCVAFLCSQLAENITGQAINVNGGDHMD